jgi:hypothetical protein
MNQSDRVGKYFDDVTETMRLKFRGWEQDLPHEGEKGGLRERRVTDFLKSILPSRYGIGSGHIIDKHGNSSGQIDIVVYDALDGIRLPSDEYYSLFPCECVYAAIEVKSTLTASEGEKPDGSIFDCVETATKVKSLQFDIQPSATGLPCIVFAYQTNWKKEEVNRVREWFHKFSVGTKKSLPDVTYVLDPGFLLCNYWKEPHYTHLYKKAPLLKLVEELHTRMQRVEVSTPDLWDSYINWEDEHVIGTIYNYKKK